MRGGRGRERGKWGKEGLVEGRGGGKGGVQEEGKCEVGGKVG